MINRVTETIKFNMLTNNMLNIQRDYSDLMEKLSTQKIINRPSDDPIGTNDILDTRAAINAIEQYQTNITDADISLSMAETALSSIRKLVADTLSIAISEAGTGSAETMNISAATVSALIDEAISLMNTKNGDSYLFAGSNTDTQPFSVDYRSANTGAATAASTNNFDGTVVSGGTYSGTENKSYAIRIITGGALDAAQYQISDDGGQTWGATLTDLSAANTPIGDGITMTFTAGTTDLDAGDFFTVSGNIGGYYSGNDDNMTVQIGKNNNFVYNITGADAFTGTAASAAIATGGVLLSNDTIVLTQGAGSWSLTSNPNYPAMNITTQTASSISIDADGDADADIILSLSGEWNSGDTTTFAITGSPTTPVLSAVSVQGTGRVDLLGTLNALHDALSSHNTDLIRDQIERLQNLETQVLQSETLAGARMRSLEMTSRNHDTLNLEITNMLADIENADLEKLITAFQMKQIAMQASYNMAAKIGEMTIMDYI